MGFFCSSPHTSLIAPSISTSVRCVLCIAQSQFLFEIKKKSCVSARGFSYFLRPHRTMPRSLRNFSRRPRCNEWIMKKPQEAHWMFYAPTIAECCYKLCGWVAQCRDDCQNKGRREKKLTPHSPLFLLRLRAFVNTWLTLSLLVLLYGGKFSRGKTRPVIKHCTNPTRSHHAPTPEQKMVSLLFSRL